MVEYIYTAVGRDGKKIKGTIAATNESRARILLKEQGIVPTKITQQTLLNKEINISIGSPVKPRDLSVFCRQFQSILKAGVTIVEALEMLADQTENKVFANAIRETKTSVQKGSTLAEAMKEHPKIYPAILINMVEAGEVSGSMEIALERMGTQFEKNAKIKGLVKKAMIYPIMILIVAVAVVIAMSIVVVPKFAVMFEDMGTEMPAMTAMIMSFSDFLIHKWYWVVIVVAVIVAGISFFAKSGRYFGRLLSTGHVNTELQRKQCALYDTEFALALSKKIIRAKTKNQLTVIFTTPPTGRETRASFSCPLACKMAFVISWVHTKNDAIARMARSPGPRTLLLG